MPAEKKIKVFNPNNLPVIDYKKLEPFQGELKEISEVNIQKLIDSIIEYGFVVPKAVWINEGHYHIVDGHSSALALKEIEKQGYVIPEIPYYKIDAENEKQAKKILLLINSRIGKITNEGFYSFIEKAGIKPDDDIFSKVDFPEIEMDKFFDNFYTDETEADDDIPLEVPAKTAEGDLWNLGRHRLLCGDSFKKENIEQLMNSKQANMILSDPPYGIDLNVDFNLPNSIIKSKDYKKVQNDDKYFDAEFMFEYFDCKEVFLWGADYYCNSIPDVEKGSWFVWDKLCGKAKGRIGNDFELCWSKNRHKKEIISIEWAGIYGLNKEFDRKRSHPTQKPIDLNAWFINKFSKQDNVIIDLFLGSGSTLIACEKTKRICYGMEIDKSYCDVIVSRYQAWCEKNGKTPEIKLNGNSYNEKG